ncbi:MAG: signal recognition particle protein [Actinomycetota bacterium]|nr:MAG: signal recognition particle protein [Actinomycetota bacterium]
MFDNLTDRFEEIFSRIRGKGRLSEAEVDAVLREIRAALIEADVNVGVVRSFIERVRANTVGEELFRSLSPAQHVIKVVNAELTNALGGENLKISYASKPPTVVLMAGLQGVGKTTAAAKLALWFRHQGRNPLLVAADLQRPAAVEQLRVLGGQASVPVFSVPGDPVNTARSGVEEARRIGRDVVIVDTAGRLSIDQELMDEVRKISESIAPNYTFLVVDAMIGQDAVNSAKVFNDALALDGIILTKLDGDARGGAALSVRQVVGKPISFVSTGEKLADFDLFYPDRMANRILGMGDVLSLIEQAERTLDKEIAEKGAKKLKGGKFDLEDFLEQMQQIKKMGPLKGVLSMLPGMPKEIRNADIDERELVKVEAIISSMTKAERTNPDMIDGSRRLRIANGAGTTTTAVGTMLKQFKDMQKMMRSMGMGGPSPTKKSPNRSNSKKKKRR